MLHHLQPKVLQLPRTREFHSWLVAQHGQCFDGRFAFRVTMHEVGAHRTHSFSVPGTRCVCGSSSSCSGLRASDASGCDGATCAVQRFVTVAALGCSLATAFVSASASAL